MGTVSARGGFVAVIQSGAINTRSAAMILGLTTLAVLTLIAIGAIRKTQGQQFTREK
jgi:Tfp pilus assembly protein PilX